MVKRLAEQGLVRHMPYRGVELTRAGRRIALRMVRRHRLVETYLVAFLGYDWDDVHDEAERLEHAVSDRLIERMAEALGNPRVDPHGDPIPTAAGEIDELVFPPLAECAAGSRVRIRRVLTSDPEHLRYLAGHGLKPGVRVQVEDRQPFRGPLTLRVAGKRRVIGHEMALRLLCSAEGGTGA
jgi:DtxR family Mn-dependent transcriptional regulator